MNGLLKQADTFTGTGGYSETDSRLFHFKQNNRHACPQKTMQTHING